MQSDWDLDEQTGGLAHPARFIITTTYVKNDHLQPKGTFDYKMFRQVIVHELAHVYLFTSFLELQCEKWPKWIHEGYATTTTDAVLGVGTVFVTEEYQNYYDRFKSQGKTFFSSVVTAVQPEGKP